MTPDAAQILEELKADCTNSILRGGAGQQQLLTVTARQVNSTKPPTVETSSDIKATGRQYSRKSN